MKILGIIPARKGSITIPNKNLYPICGVPMIEYTIGAAKASKLDDVIISTDYDKNIFEDDIFVLKRPKRLADKDAKMIDVIKHAAEYFDYDAYMILQPTSPLRLMDDIDDAIDRFLAEENPKSLYSGYYIGIKHKNKAYNKFENEPHFQRNGAIFLFTKELLMQGKMWDDDVVEFEMPKSRSIDIDDMEDLEIVEALITCDVLGD
jgi:CMP-N,N'-diacetyllegionaminic acid synthase